MKKYVAIAAIVCLTACGGSNDNSPTPAPAPPDQPLSQSKNVATFNDKFGTFLSNYFHLKDAFVLSNDSLAGMQARMLAASADSLDLKDIKADSSIVQMARQYVESVAAEANALIGEKNLEAKRKSFQMISDTMYDLVRTVRYDQQVVYHQYCPMAFNDAGAYWLSAANDIKNPYFGKKMLTCGEVKDSIDFRGK